MVIRSALFVSYKDTVCIGTRTQTVVPRKIFLKSTGFPSLKKFPRELLGFEGMSCIPGRSLLSLRVSLSREGLAADRNQYADAMRKTMGQPVCWSPWQRVVADSARLLARLGCLAWLALRLGNPSRFAVLPTGSSLLSLSLVLACALPLLTAPNGAHIMMAEWMLLLHRVDARGADLFSGSLLFQSAPAERSATGG